MNIYKLVYADTEQFSDEDYAFLKDQNIISYTDYGTVEIMAEVVQDCKDKEVLRVLEENLGKGVYKALVEGVIDFVQVA